MKRILKLIFYNIIVLFALVLIIEFASSVILDMRHFYTNIGPGKSKKEERALLPNYEKAEWAKKHFEEYNKPPTEYRSYFGWRRLYYEGTTIHIDSSGVRQTIQNSNEKDELPIAVFLGGSTTWGVGADDEHTIPSLFAKKFEKEYHVHNYGEIGYSAYQSIQYLQLKLIEGLHPKLIITYDGVNNTPVYLPRHFSHCRENQMISVLKGQDKQPPYKPFFLSATKALLKTIRSYFVSSSKSNLNLAPGITKKRSREAAIELLESWLYAKNLSDKVGADFLCVLQPNAFVGNPETTYIEEELSNSRYKNAYGYYEDMLELIENKKYRVLKDHFLNLTHSFDNTPYVYIDFCHISPNGNEIIADTLARHLKRIKQIP